MRGSMTKGMRAPDNHVVGFSDLVDLWVKPIILCARSTPRGHAAGTRERFVYSIEEQAFMTITHGRHMF